MNASHTETSNRPIIKKGFEKQDGVFVKSIDNALGTFNVEKQAYRGGSFIGSHSTRRSLVPAAQSISVKFERALSLFAKCHILYNSSSKLSASDANDLGTMTLDYTK